MTPITPGLPIGEHPADAVLMPAVVQARLALSVPMPNMALMLLWAACREVEIQEAAV